MPGSRKLFCACPLPYLARAYVLARSLIRACAPTAQGAVGKDEFASLQEKVASKDGMRTHYLRVDGFPTGKCAVLVVDGERSLVASLGAAEQYKVRARSPPPEVGSGSRLFSHTPPAAFTDGPR